MTNRVLVCGGRDYVDRARLFAVLDHYHLAAISGGFAVVIHGAARGADLLAAEWAGYRGVPHEPYPADWDNLDTRPRRICRRRDGSLYNAKAGSLRNTQMLREGKPTVVIAFPGGDGTANMIEQARRAGVPVLEIPAC